MKALCFALIFVCLAVCSCESRNTEKPAAVSVTNTDSIAAKKKTLAAVYNKAIGDYIQEVKREYELQFDTLYFGKHVYGQPDDFPDIELAPTIANTNIRLISPEDGQQLQQEQKNSFYINLIGWVDSTTADFTFVTFSNGFSHQFDVFISYQYNALLKEFEKKEVRFENYAYKKP